MRLHALLGLGLFAATAFAQAQAVAPPAPITYDQAVANEKSLFAADQKHDMEAIKSLVADDFLDINKDGSSEDKAALLKEIPTLKLLHYEQQNFRVLSMGPYAYTISYDSDATVVGAGGKETHAHNILNTVWIWRDGRWQILLHCRGEQKVLSAK
ncbi:MAG: nuclear transport factor 2 family protein [Candidatus Sulfotelmatobacter sp.]